MTFYLGDVVHPNISQVFATREVSHQLVANSSSHLSEGLFAIDGLQ